MRLHHDLDIAIETREKAHQAINGVFPKLAFKHAGYLGLSNPHKFAGLGLGELTFVGQPVNLRDNLRLEEMGIGIGQPKISKRYCRSLLPL